MISKDHTIYLDPSSVKQLDKHNTHKDIKELKIKYTKRHNLMKNNGK